MKKGPTQSEVVFAKISNKIYKLKLWFGLLVTGYITIQFILFIAREYNYIYDWALTLIPTYFAVVLMIVFFFVIIDKSKTKWFSCDNFLFFCLMAAIVVFVILLTVFLEQPESIDAFAVFFPSATITLILFAIYAIRIGYEGTPKSSKYIMIDEKNISDLNE